MKILVTGGAGFIGSAVVRLAVARGHQVVNVDALTYAADLRNVAEAEGPALRLRAGRHPRPRRARPDLRRTSPDAVMHLAAESHVDRSIDGAGHLRRDQRHGHLPPARGGAGVLAGAGQAAGLPLPPHLDRRGLRQPRRRGPVHRRDALRPALALFGDQGRFRPPGARLGRNLRPAGGADQLLEQLRAVPLPGKADPGGDPERAAGRPIPVYGAGENVRDWLFVEDHADALLLVLQKGAVGRSYNIGGENERRNIDLVRTICRAARRAPPRGRPARGTHRVRHRPPGPRPALRHRPDPHPDSWAGARA